MEYGTIIIGFVGRAKNGCDEPIDSGVLELSSLVFGYADFGVKGFAVVGIGGPDLNNIENRNKPLLTTLLKRKGKMAIVHTHHDVYRYNSVVYERDKFSCWRIECHSLYNIDRSDVFGLMAVVVVFVAPIK